MKAIAFFNNKGGVGKTTLVYHLAWMYAELGASVVAADLDPQANLTTMFLSEDRLLELWPEGTHERSILGSVARYRAASATSPNRMSKKSPSISGWWSGTSGSRVSRPGCHPHGQTA